MGTLSDPPWLAHNREHWDAYRRAVTQALAPFKEARQAVIAALEERAQQSVLAQELIRDLRQIDQQEGRLSGE